MARRTFKKNRQADKASCSKGSCVRDPGCYDVLCGRGNTQMNHVGNRRFRITIAMNLDKYLSLETRIQKSNHVMSIVATIRQSGGRFLKKDTTASACSPSTPAGNNNRKKSFCWKEIGDKLAREKVGHALRDAEAERSRRLLSKKGQRHHLRMSSQPSANRMDFTDMFDHLLADTRTTQVEKKPIDIVPNNKTRRGLCSEQDSTCTATTTSTAEDSQSEQDPAEHMECALHDWYSIQPLEDVDVLTFKALPPMKNQSTSPTSLDAVKSSDGAPLLEDALFYASNIPWSHCDSDLSDNSF